MKNSEDEYEWVIARSGTGLVWLVRRLESYNIPVKIQHEAGKTILLVPKKYLKRVDELEDFWPHGFDEE